MRDRLEALKSTVSIYPCAIETRRFRIFAVFSIVPPSELQPRVSIHQWSDRDRLVKITTSKLCDFAGKC